MKLYRQRDMTDCGATCLAYVAAHHGKEYPIARLRLLAGTNQKGSTALGMVSAAQQIGFTAKGVKGSADALPTVPLPAIAHCLINQQLLHYVVLVSWTPKYAGVMDPAVGRVEKWSHEKFKAVWTGVLILLAPGEKFQAGRHTATPSARLWSLLRPERGVLVQAFVGAVASTLLGLGMAFYVQKIVDNVIPDGNRALLNLLGIVMLAVLAARLVLGWFQSVLAMHMAQRIDAHILLGYYGHLLRLPQQFFDTMRVGEITSRMRDAIKIRVFLNSTLLGLMLNPLILVFSLAAMFFYSWKLALLALALAPFYAGIYALADFFNKRFQREMMERSADFESQLVESLNAQRAIRAQGLEEHTSLRTETRLVRLMRTGWSAALAGLGTGTAGSLVTQTFVIGLLWLGAGLVLDAGLSTGQLMSCYTLAGYLTGPIIALIGMNAAVRDALIATDRLYEIMDLEREKDEGHLTLDASTMGDIRFENVSFRHPGRLPTLQNITLTIPRGKITALVGESGCGKSTLLALLQRHYVPERGRVTLGGADLAYFRLESLRAGLSVVPQKIDLLSGTILENIAPGEYPPDMARVLHACRAAGALEFVEQLPQNFLTLLGENATNLSGGQRQRLVLARALYRDAPIFLLDEPSSALDAKAESTLMETLVQLRDAGKTVVIAAHTPRVVATADQIVTMVQGQILSGEKPGSSIATSAKSPDNAAQIHHQVHSQLWTANGRSIEKNLAGGV